VRALEPTRHLYNRRDNSRIRASKGMPVNRKCLAKMWEYPEYTIPCTLCSKNQLTLTLGDEEFSRASNSSTIGHGSETGLPRNKQLIGDDPGWHVGLIPSRQFNQLTHLCKSGP
jgi:hypothetical protein